SPETWAPNPDPAREGLQHHDDRSRRDAVDPAAPDGIEDRGDSDGAAAPPGGNPRTRGTRLHDQREACRCDPPRRPGMAERSRRPYGTGGLARPASLYAGRSADAGPALA